MVRISDKNWPKSQIFSEFGTKFKLECPATIVLQKKNSLVFAIWQYYVRQDYPLGQFSLV